MENRLSNPRRAISLGDISKFTPLNIQKYLSNIEGDQENNDEKLLIKYLDNIRNYKKLTAEMIENISKMKEENKMEIIKEINTLMEVIRNLSSID
jgi:hypothetical protein